MSTRATHVVVDREDLRLSGSGSGEGEGAYSDDGLGEHCGVSLMEMVLIFYVNGGMVGEVDKMWNCGGTSLYEVPIPYVLLVVLRCSTVVLSTSVMSRIYCGAD